jgi:hypothetical protein
MIHVLDVRHGSCEERFIEDGAVQKLDVFRIVVWARNVENPDAVAARFELGDKMAPDEAVTASDQCQHCRPMGA